MLRDLGSRDTEFMDTIKYIRRKVLEIAKISTEDFTMIPMQGSGTFSIEASIMTLLPRTGAKLLVAYTGSYGKRITEIAAYSGIETVCICYFKQFLDNFSVLYFLITPGNPQFCSVYTGYKMGTLARNEITLFMPVFYFYTPWKCQKTKGFLTFSGGLEIGHWRKKG